MSSRATSIKVIHIATNEQNHSCAKEDFAALLKATVLRRIQPVSPIGWRHQLRLRLGEEVSTGNSVKTKPLRPMSSPKHRDSGRLMKFVRHLGYLGLPRATHRTEQ